MSGFVDRLVARGAALGAVPGVVSLHPRPLTRFEGGQDAGAIEADSVERIAVPRDDARPAVDTPIRQAAIPRARRAGAEELVRQVPRAGRPARTDVPRHPVSEDKEILGSDGIDAAAQIRTGKDGADPVDAARQDAMDEPVSSPVGLPAPVPATEPAGHEDIVEATVQAPVSAPLEILSLPPVEGEERPEVALRALPLPTEHLDAPPQVTVSVGRIEVQFAQPARSAAAPAPRPRGFASYASARRGNPR